MSRIERSNEKYLRPDDARALRQALVDSSELVGDLAPVESWQPIDSAPKGGSDDEILLWFPWTGELGCMMIGVWGYASDGERHCWVDPHEYQMLGDPSHWRPLPKPPERT